MYMFDVKSTMGTCFYWVNRYMYDVKSRMGTCFNGVEIAMVLICTYGNLV